MKTKTTMENSERELVMSPAALSAYLALEQLFCACVELCTCGWMDDGEDA